MTRAERAIRLATIATVGYLAVTLVPLVVAARHPPDVAIVVLHVCALLFGVAFIATRVERYGALRRWYRWYPFAMVLPIYVELGRLIAAAGQPHRDALVAQWEHALFPSNPSRTLALAFPNVIVSETLHFCYLAYYAIVFLPLVRLFLKDDEDGFAATSLAMSIVYVVCFAAYVVFPVDGPRFTIGPALAKDGIIRSVVLSLLQSASSRGTAFPSSHVAAAVVATVFALRYQRKVGWIVGVLTVGLSIGAVYGGFHYAVDIVAGALVGVGLAGGAWWIWSAEFSP